MMAALTREKRGGVLQGGRCGVWTDTRFAQTDPLAKSTMPLG